MFADFPEPEHAHNISQSQKSGHGQKSSSSTALQLQAVTTGRFSFVSATVGSNVAGLSTKQLLVYPAFIPAGVGYILARPHSKQQLLACFLLASDTVSYIVASPSS